jgi:hypothetical protein
VKFRGYLANENAELLRAVIHAGARPHKTSDGELDPRSREKRQADALTTALTLAATAWDTHTSTTGNGTSNGGSDGNGVRARRGSVVPGYGAKATITITIDLNDLMAATADAIGHTVYGDGLSAAAVRRLACDAAIIPIVLGANSEPLDVGRRERLVTKAMRHALNTRDRGCVVCGAPPIMCDAHHLISWLDGGATKVSNLALLCRRHHVDLHAGRWHITITDGQVHVARPTWTQPPPTRKRRKPPAPPSTHARPRVAAADTHSAAACPPDPAIDTTARTTCDAEDMPNDAAGTPDGAVATAYGAPGTSGGAGSAGSAGSAAAAPWVADQADAAEPAVSVGTHPWWRSDEATLRAANAFAAAD